MGNDTSRAEETEERNLNRQRSQIEKQVRMLEHKNEFLGQQKIPNKTQIDLNKRLIRSHQIWIKKYANLQLQANQYAQTRKFASAQQNVRDLLEDQLEELKEYNGEELALMHDDFQVYAKQLEKDTVTMSEEEEEEEQQEKESPFLPLAPDHSIVLEPKQPERLYHKIL